MLAKPPAPAPAAPLQFAFWDDHQYREYGRPEQDVLNREFAKDPRPENVSLPGRRPGEAYVLLDFLCVETAGAVQVNSMTGFERHVRLQPPYRLPCAAASVPSVPPRGRFQYHHPTGQWRDYDPTMQRELQAFAACAPVPEKVLFKAAGRKFWVLNFQDLVCSRADTCFQVQDGGRGGAAGDPCTVRMLTAAGPGAARQRTARLEVSRALFGARPPGPREAVQLDDAAQAVLRLAWVEAPRRDVVELPDGRSVEGFRALEVGGARASRAGPSWNIGGATRPAIELRVPPPEAGEVVLPDELEGEEVLNLDALGRWLTPPEVQELVSGSGSGECAICCCSMAPDRGAGNAGILELACGHAYHGPCLDQWFRLKRRCPECQREFGKLMGNQPRVGIFRWSLEDHRLPGHDDSRQMIVIEFEFPSGDDDQGKTYMGRKPKGYLPANTQGFVLLELFKIAFRRRVMFGLGTSMTFQSYRPTFNIHIKTSTHRGVAGHGYPDPDYFTRTMDELNTNGVTLKDLPP